jgi:hypothetical protein
VAAGAGGAVGAMVAAGAQPERALNSSTRIMDVANVIDEKRLFFIILYLLKNNLGKWNYTTNP